MFSSLLAPSSLSSSLISSLVSVKVPPVTGSLIHRRDLLSIRIRASSNQNGSDYCFTNKLKSFAKSAILIGADVFMTGKFSTLLVKLESPVVAEKG
ncbi:protein SLOW GREEN 1 [Cardamine amara subsp. amara]|uniref:Protein SLOW GREEN 1 n=1 Tax=Cardamine amara subsp. amara TaxID=228776 RepID=A0ABD1BS98_CARAN